MFLLTACQTTSQPTEPIVKAVSVAKKEILQAFETVKPLACVELNLALASLEKDHGEIPYAIWHDPSRDNRILMTVNKKTKTATIMEYIPTPDAPEFKDIGETQYICLLTTGIGLYINSEVETTKISY
jgi:hypothetical protein